MKNRINLKIAVFIAALSFFVLPVPGQTARPDFNRSSDYDVQHYVIRVSFDQAKKQVFGDTTVRLKPLKDGYKRVVLDSIGISYSSVALEGGDIPLTFKTQGKSVIVDLDREYSAGETVAVRFKYTATPKKGIYFVAERKASEGFPGHSAQIWTQGEPEEARYWFPSFDFPSDKATAEQFITAKKGDSVIGNGAFLGKADNPDGTSTHHFRMDVPFPTYLVSFVVGGYVRIDEKYKEIPLGYYVYPGTESIVPKAYGKTKEMFRIFEDITKIDYPFVKYDQTIVASFSFGGMENITATTMADSEIFLAGNPLFGGGVEDLVSHELAHSWFGNLVTCKNWAELWLNEGFATFFEAVSREKLYGREAYIFKVMNDAERFLAEDAVNTKRHGLFNRNAADVDSLFDRAGTTYNKGGAVLHTLREQVGEEAFWKGVNVYLNRHKYGSVETTDLKKAMEESSGQDLGWFFDQWVYGLGAPKLTVRHTYAAASRTLTVTITQTQRQERFTPAAFKLPLDIEIQTPRGTVSDKAEVDARIKTFRYKVPARPSKIVVDKNEKIPVKSVRIVAGPAPR
ncbi:MAG: M1 family metallopeptidase [Pyrinomonadaceae bacterium]